MKRLCRPPKGTALPQCSLSTLPSNSEYHTFPSSQDLNLLSKATLVEPHTLTQAEALIRGELTQGQGDSNPACAHTAQ